MDVLSAAVTAARRMLPAAASGSAAGAEQTSPLSAHEALRERKLRITAPQTFRDSHNEPLTHQVDYCAAMSSAIYDSTATFRESLASAAHLRVRDERLEVPNLDGTTCIESAEVVIGRDEETYVGCRMGVVTLSVRYHGILWEELYFVYRGSQDMADWISNSDFTPTATEVDGIMVMSGMHSAWNTSKRYVEDRIHRARAGGHLLRVFFTGHSRGAGVAMLAHLQCSTNFPDLQNLMYGIGFSSPPVFYFEDRSHEQAAQVCEYIAKHSLNIFAEFDIVVWIGQSRFLNAALGSLSGNIPLHRLLPFPMPQFATNYAINQFLSRVVDKLQRIQAAFLDKFEHTASLCVAKACGAAWTWVHLSTPQEKAQFFSKPWPFPGEQTNIPILDHTWMPRCVLPGWQTDGCRSCSYLLGDLQGAPSLFDCLACKRTWCAACSLGEAHNCPKEWATKRATRVANLRHRPAPCYQEPFPEPESWELLTDCITALVEQFQTPRCRWESLVLGAIRTLGFPPWLQPEDLTIALIDEQYKIASERDHPDRLFAEANGMGFTKQKQQEAALRGHKLMASNLCAKELLLRTLEQLQSHTMRHLRLQAAVIQ